MNVYGRIFMGLIIGFFIGTLAGIILGLAIDTPVIFALAILGAISGAVISWTFFDGPPAKRYKTTAPQKRTTTCPGCGATFEYETAEAYCPVCKWKRL